VTLAREAGLNVGAFFIVCYPGETNETVLDTLRFAPSLPLITSASLPYPLPNTALHERITERINKSWRRPESGFLEHICIFDADFSETKRKFAIIKGQITFLLNKKLGKRACVAARLFELATDSIRTDEVIALAGLTDNRRDRDRFQQKNALTVFRWHYCVFNVYMNSNEEIICCAVEICSLYCASVP